MKEYLLLEGEYLLRVVLAAVCGAIIGYERKSKLKEAGVRTHMLVALGSALLMVISKYGFGDILSQPGMELDPSRIASQIVSGVGFLGAGMIFMRHLSVTGLTTAAGIWTTAALGMAMGAGLYPLAITATLLVLLVQALFRRELKWLHLPAVEQLTVVFSESTDAISFLQETLAFHHVEIMNFKAEKSQNGLLSVELMVKLPPGYNVFQLMNLFKDNPHVNMIEY